MKNPRTHGRKDQQKTLRDRIDLVSETQPEILELRDKLLEIGGEELVATPLELGLDPFAPVLTKLGEVMQYPVKLREMEASQCHHNVEKLLKGKKLTAMGTGYGLSDDGLWRSHSWGLKQIRGELLIIETTVSREIYFGVPVHREALRACGVIGH
jgi:hypothetical protein